jgi:hypothetical protein
MGARDEVVTPWSLFSLSYPNAVHGSFVVIIARRRKSAIVTLPRDTITLRRNILLRKEDGIARRAQARSVASEACSDAVMIRYIGSAEPEYVRGTGFSLFVGSPSECAVLKCKHNRKCGCAPKEKSIRRR